MTRTALLLAFAVALSACAVADSDEQGSRPQLGRIDEHGNLVLSAEEQQALGVDTVVATVGKIATSELRFGTVLATPEQDVRVIAPVTARFVISSVSLGTEVRKGDVLAAIEPLADAAAQANIAARRQELKGQVRAARARIEAARVEYERVSRLVHSDLATPAEGAQAKAALAGEEAVASSLADADAALAKMDNGVVAVRAPVSGMLIELATRGGSMLRQGDTVARIVRPGPPWVDVAVPPDDPPGMRYTVIAAGTGFPATLAFRGRVVHDGRRTDRLDITGADSDILLPGTTVSVRVHRDLSGVLVPVSAVVRQGDAQLCVLQLGEGIYAARRIEVKGRNGGTAVVTDGLAGGEYVVSTGAAALVGEFGLSGRPVLPARAVQKQ